MTRLTSARPRALTAAAVVLAVPAALLAAGPATGAPSGLSTSTLSTSRLSTAALAPAVYDRTSAVEAKRVDSVPTPKLGWYPCYQTAQCATVDLPLDYDRPTGAKTQVAVLRVPARDRAHRIGSLFVNPGGPGGSGTQLALGAPFFLSPGLLDQFDVVGFDPRGIAFSDNVKCFPNNAAQAAAYAGLNVAFPYTKAEETAYVASAKAVGRACSTTGQPLASSMSTAEVARDMDVLRRAVGDTKLTYLGFSYGTYLGQVYANLFPDRLRALVIDGVLDPVAWAGTPATANVPQTTRLKSGEGAYKALHEILVRCDKAGGQLCPFAPGDPVKNFDVIAERLKTTPLQIVDPFSGQVFEYSYAAFISDTLSALYAPTGSQYIAANLADLIILTEPPAVAAGAGAAAASAARAARLKAFAARVAKAKADAAQQRRFDFPYDSSLEGFAAVLCSDGLNPQDASSWPAAAAAADRAAKYFGRLWTWASPFCARNTWKALDEDAYRGPFTHRTINPVLVVGDYWDPATNYAGAVKAASLLPNSRLLTSDSWGHTAYGTSACVTDAVDAYLLTRALPAKGTVCVGDAQPFTAPPGAAARVAVPGRGLPPVIAPVAPTRG